MLKFELDTLVCAITMAVFVETLVNGIRIWFESNFRGRDYIAYHIWIE